MAFGEIDFRQLDRLGQGLAQFNQGQAKVDQAKLAAEQDAADRKIAQEASTAFYSAIDKAGLTKTATSTTGPMNYEAAFSAAAKAGDMLARGGGRHSQAAAMRIHQWLDDFVKIKQLNSMANQRIVSTVNPMTGQVEWHQLSDLAGSGSANVPTSAIGQYTTDKGNLQHVGASYVQPRENPLTKAKSSRTVAHDPGSGGGGAGERGAKTQIDIPVWTDDPTSKAGGKIAPKRYTGKGTQVTEQIERDKLVTEDALKPYTELGLDLNAYADGTKTPSMKDPDIQKIRAPEEERANVPKDPNTGMPSQLALDQLDNKYRLRAIGLVQSWQKLKSQGERLAQTGYGVGERFQQQSGEKKNADKKKTWQDVINGSK